MKQPKYLVSDVIADTASALRGSDDQATTTIRCVINDLRESYSRNGYILPEFNQDYAVKSVKRLLNKYKKLDSKRNSL